MTPLKSLALFFALLFSSLSFANSMFTAEEIQKHRENLDMITKAAADCLDETFDDHIQFFKKWGVSKYYGERRTEFKGVDGRVSRDKLIIALKRSGAPVSLIDQLKPSSCIGLTVKCLGRGFAAGGMQDTWGKIMARLKIGDLMLGTDLQAMLQQLGWKIYYWNPDPAQNAVWDREDRTLNPLKDGQTWNPVWGGHANHYAEVMNKSVYYKIHVDDAEKLVNFGTSVPRFFTQVPFFVGTAHVGYHVFPGRRGEVIEGHSTRPLNSIDNMQFSTFNPLNGLKGGGPQWTNSEHYRSGLIAIPGAL